MRAGHDDREQVIAELKAAFVQGRLDKDELEERAGRAVVSRTYGELAALTADIPDPAAEAPAAVGRPGASTPGRTLARGAKRAGICLLAAAALMEAAFLTDNFLLIVAATFAALAAGGFLGYGIIDAVQERRALAQLAPGPGSRPGPGGPGPTGGPSAGGPALLDRRVPPGRSVPPAGRAGPTPVEARGRQPAVRLQRGWAVS
jgi:hypothetical protein